MGDHTRQVLRALEKRIAQCGDMPIRVSPGTVAVLMRALGLSHWQFERDEFREIDGLALDALRYLAKQRLPA